jgi:16S rRNA (cytosine1402-N4)-methyltransferase
MEPATFYHQSVLLEEAVAALDIKANGVYVDGTFGGGGHSRAILGKLGAKGRLIVFDQDRDSWKNLPDDKRVMLVKENFQYLRRFLKLHGAPQVDGILVDLGVSSFQFDTAERGFSTRFDAALDMRMDDRSDFKAADIIRDYSEAQLHQILEQYGEVRNAKTLAETIVKGRKNRNIAGVHDFKALIADCIKGNPNRYLAQVFQALRIEVNNELGVLKLFLAQTPGCLKQGGRLCVITFHSLEDRIVKRFMKNGGFEKDMETDVFGNKINQNPLHALKDVLPSDKETRENPRSRSARLRVAEKI